MRWITQLLAVCLTAITTTAQVPAFAMPRLGTWEAITQWDGGEALQTTFTITRTDPEGSTFEAIFEYGMDKTIFSTILSGKLDRQTGRLNMYWRETHTNLPPNELPGGGGQMEGELSEDGKSSMSLMFANDPIGQKVRAKWVGGSPTPWRAPLKATKSTDSELNQILSQWSGDFQIGDIRVLRGNDPITLNRLANSKDPVVQTLAASKNEILKVSDLEVAEIRRQLARYKNEVQKEAAGAMFGVSVLDIVGLLFSDAVEIKADASSRQVGLLVLKADALSRLIPSLKKELIARSKAATLGRDGFEFRFVTDGERDLELWVTNKSRRSLRDVFVYGLVNIDAAKMTAYRDEYMTSRRELFWVHNLTGAPVKQHHQLLMHLYGLPQYSTAFLVEWRPDQTLKLKLPDPDMVRTIGESAEFWMYSNQGTFEQELKIEDIKEMLQRLPASR